MLAQQFVVILLASDLYNVISAETSSSNIPRHSKLWRKTFLCSTWRERPRFSFSKWFFLIWKIYFLYRIWEEFKKKKEKTDTHMISKLIKLFAAVFKFFWYFSQDQQCACLFFFLSFPSLARGGILYNKCTAQAPPVYEFSLVSTGHLLDNPESLNLLA